MVVLVDSVKVSLHKSTCTWKGNPAQFLLNLSIYIRGMPHGFSRRVDDR